jgi:hypothetical protein
MNNIPPESVSTTSTPKRELRKYTRADKELYALQWLLHGQLDQACKAANIPRQTAQSWMKSRWWNSLIEVVRLRHKEEIEAKYEHIIAKSAEQIIDRLDNGDSVLMKNGAIKKVPVKAKELAGVMGTAQDKLRTSRNQPNTISINATLNLGQLASNFAKAGRLYQRELNGRVPEPMAKLPFFGEQGENTDNIDDVEYEEVPEDLDNDGST